MGAERKRLAESAAWFRNRLGEAGLDTGASATQIVPVMLGDEQRTLKAAAALEECGLLGIAIRPPTVPPGTSRIRFALSAAHCHADIERLAEAVIQVTQ